MAGEGRECEETQMRRGAEDEREERGVRTVILDSVVAGERLGE